MNKAVKEAKVVIVIGNTAGCVNFLNLGSNLHNSIDKYFELNRIEIWRDNLGLSLKMDEEIPQARRLRKKLSIDAVIKTCQLL